MTLKTATANVALSICTLALCLGLYTLYADHQRVNALWAYVTAQAKTSAPESK